MIELIKNYPCSCLDELRREEGKHIRAMDCVNRYVAGRTQKEWYEDNKEQIKEYHKEYYKDNKEKIQNYLIYMCIYIATSWLHILFLI